MYVIIYINVCECSTYIYTIGFRLLLGLVLGYPQLWEMKERKRKRKGRERERETERGRGKERERDRERERAL